MRQRFVEEFLVDLNATQAAIRAGYAPGSAKSQASRLLTIDDVAAAIAEGQKRLRERTGNLAERVIAELEKLAFSDMRAIAGWRSNVLTEVEDPDTGDMDLVHVADIELKGSHELTDAAAASIKEISKTRDGALKIKLHDKRGPLVDLGRHLGLFAQPAKPPVDPKKAAADTGDGAETRAPAGDDWSRVLDDKPPVQ